MPGKMMFPGKLMMKCSLT